MLSPKRCTIGISIGLVLMMILALSNATSAFADGGGTLSPDISAGGLTVANNGPLPTPSAKLSGANQTLGIALPLVVTNANGTGAGWTLTASADQFAFDNNNTLETLPKAITLLEVTNVQCDAINSSCVLPTNSAPPGSITAVAAVDTSGTISWPGTGSSLNFYNAAAGSGEGTIDLTAVFSVPLPVTTYAGTYRGSITITIS